MHEEGLTAYTRFTSIVEAVHVLRWEKKRNSSILPIPEKAGTNARGRQESGRNNWRKCACFSCSSRHQPSETSKKLLIQITVAEE